MQNKLNALLNDEAFVKELFAQETAEDAQKLLASKGVEISAEELENIRKSLIAKTESNEEMNDESLEQVAGGANAIKGGLAVIFKMPTPWLDDPNYLKNLNNTTNTPSFPRW